MPDYDHILAYEEALKMVADPLIVMCRDGGYRTKSWKTPHIVGRGKTRDLALEDYFSQLTGTGTRT